MSTRDRRERERAEREQLIIDVAQDLAEAEGWDAVTTRRLAERVEYSQPVLYSHFTSKDAIVRAVALRGFGMLADELHAARTSYPKTMDSLRAVADAYLRFAKARPALYEAMFVRDVAIAFGTDDAPPEPRAAFGEIVAALEPVAIPSALETYAEVFWSALHGTASLARRKRLRPEYHLARMDLMMTKLFR
ncbi:TetR/AcrR family transcriptional regulator [Lentzea tibetensis]|uniref:TetR/AcrR family transcriptional regulator n=1 Tax=Lentzea tibetensis TaxID=2591470 RepID=A0A563EMV7_9PSEU|nr:TetR/AcrR family transcriptional regulator [Lentzea tibetensis]TWP48421.1 TetR/AcrR family transcriptional regulator [Lentzea tibetensis]